MTGIDSWRSSGVKPQAGLQERETGRWGLPGALFVGDMHTFVRVTLLRLCSVRPAHRCTRQL